MAFWLSSHLSHFSFFSFCFVVFFVFISPHGWHSSSFFLSFFFSFLLALFLVFFLYFFFCCVIAGFLPFLLAFLLACLLACFVVSLIFARFGVEVLIVVVQLVRYMFSSNFTLFFTHIRAFLGPSRSGVRCGRLSKHLLEQGARAYLLCFLKYFQAYVPAWRLRGLVRVL